MSTKEEAAAVAVNGGAAAADLLSPTSAVNLAASPVDSTGAAKEGTLSPAGGNHPEMILHRITVRNRPTLAQRFKAFAPGLTSGIERWFSTPETDTRTPAQLEREKWVLGFPASGAYKRWMIVIPSFVIQLCIGSLYSWSIFNAPLDAVWGELGANAQAFTIAIAAEGLVTLLAGPLIERSGPYRCVLYATLLCPLAWAFACLGAWQAQRAIVYVLWGIPLGIAGAFGFVGCVANMTRWFPDFKGLAAGFTVMGFGVGGMMWQLVGNEWMLATGPYAMAPWRVFGCYAIIFAVVMACCLPFIRAPPPDFVPPPSIPYEKQSAGMKVLSFLFPTSKPTPPDKPYTYLEAIMQLEYVLIAIAMFGTFLPGVVFMSSAADMTKYVFGKDPAYANLIAAMLNVMNFSGRVIWGVIAERVGRKTFYLIANIAQAVALGLMALWIHIGSFPLWLVSFFIVGSVYGGSHGVLPAFLNQMFGSKIAGALHGSLLFVWALSDVVGVPIFSSVVADHTTIINGKKVGTPEAYMINAYWLCAMPLLAAVALCFLDTGAADRTLRKAFKECRVRCCGRVCVIKCLSQPEQEREFAAYTDAMKVHHRVRAGTRSVFDKTLPLELQSIPGLLGIYDVHGKSTRALSLGHGGVGHDRANDDGGAGVGGDATEGGPEPKEGDTDRIHVAVDGNGGSGTGSGSGGANPVR